MGGTTYKENVKRTNPILQKDELFVEIRKDNSHAYKLGDGIHPYSELDYIDPKYIPYEFTIYGRMYGND